ncbi:MAG: TOBE domain-containing protein [Gammaproteobacteria bacterium]
MNRLRGRIAAIESSGQLSLVDVDVDGDTFTAIIVETPDSAGYLKLGGEILLLFKETEVSLAKNLSGLISLRNRIPASVQDIVEGDLLSQVTLDYKGNRIVSIITSRSVRRLELKTGDQVEGLVKANEMTLMECDCEL